jgi:uroporphyrinogen decarboxylase
MCFGWERFLEAAAVDPAGFSAVLDQFAEVSRRNVAAWVADDRPVLFIHDDVAVTRGLVFSPAWYRRELFPRYERILEPAFKAGRTVVFVSDGRFEELVDDLFALGIHGVMADHSNDLAGILARHGDRHSVIGSIDTGVLTRGTPDDVRREVDIVMRLGRRFPGFFLKAAGDVPHNVPLENARAYFAAKAELGTRG